MNFLLVVDMQNDFISGSLGSAHAAAIVSNVVKMVSSFDGTVYPNRHAFEKGRRSRPFGK